MKKANRKTVEAAVDTVFGGIYNSEGHFQGVNVNVLIARYLERHPTVCLGDARYFRYSKRDSVWRETSLTAIKRKLRRFLHKFESDSWSYVIDRDCSTIFPLECPKAEKLSSPEGFVNLKNGLYSLDTFSLHPHDSGVFSTVQLPIKYDPEARCPRFQAFLDQVLGGDKRLVRLMVEILGYALSPVTQAQKFFVFTSSGCSGKSTLGNILYRLAGGSKNVSSVPLNKLNDRFSKSVMVDKVLNLNTESDSHHRFDPSTLKAIVTGDPVMIEGKGKQPYSARITAKQVFAVNTLPQAKDHSYAYLRRLILINFPMTFVDDPKGPFEAKVDRNIEERLLDELPGIFNLAMRGLKRLQMNGYRFSRSEASERYLDAYMKELNPILDFAASQVGKNDKTEVSTTELYFSFCGWLSVNGFSKTTLPEKRRFLREFRMQLNSLRIPYTERKSGNSRYFVGIELTREARALAKFDFSRLPFHGL